MFFASDAGSRNVAPTYNQEVCVRNGPDGYITNTPEKGGDIEIHRINMPRAPAAGPKAYFRTKNYVQECLAGVILPPQHEHFDEDLPVRNQMEETIVSERLAAAAHYVLEGECDAAYGFREQVESAMKWTHCTNKAKINRSILEDKDGKSFKKTYGLKPKSFRWGKFIEAAWAHIDFVRNFCFKGFLPRMNHIWKHCSRS